MLADAHEALECQGRAGGDQIKEYSELLNLKAELSRRDEIEGRLLERLKDCDMEAAQDMEQRVSARASLYLCCGFMCICTYVYVYTNEMCICVCVCVCMCAHVHVYVRVRMI